MSASSTGKDVYGVEAVTSRPAPVASAVDVYDVKDAAAVAAKAPPEERFWVRYSPHHEFSLSSASSFLIHLLGLGLIILAAILVSRFGPNDNPPEVGGIEIGGGGGNPLGVGVAPNTGVVPAGNERTETVKNQSAIIPPTVPTEKLPTVEPDRTPVLAPPTESPRQIDTSDATTNLAQASSAVKQLQDRIDGAIAGHGKGGSGQGGGSGKGVGTGDGDSVGPGTGKMDIRKKRQSRWVMSFNTLSGQDYANQLRGLGAILAVQQEDGGFMVYRDLGTRPVVGKVEDLAGLDRIYWIDDKPQSVSSLSAALGIKPTPSAIVAFFPQELEKKLLDLEIGFLRKRRPGAKEDDIRATRFQIQPRGVGRYEPIVVGQD